MEANDTLSGSTRELNVVSQDSIPAVTSRTVVVAAMASKMTLPGYEKLSCGGTR